MAKGTEKEHTIMLMGTSIQVIGWMTTEQVTAFSLILMVIDRRDNARMTRRTEKEHTISLMGTSTQVIGWMTTEQVTAFSLILMVIDRR
jgi:uncharacterized membrane protein YsdA (DUF1294 family)